ncbi:LysR family transcriptional regulator [Rahnella sp. SAP-1]|uniref:LysR family transcriptional regulator n=1 Tax=Rouxiella aceris TaxID=2703884 RepID=A0A848MLR6_9GAMM|nr:LysR family transcriptional regulator [Rouxiella aceris]NMP29347.1 LysR family transcriptional regulator [Rouxiella aceris]
MKSRDNLNDYVAFVTVAREKSFTRAAAQLGVSQSALSHTIRGLESSLGVRLLTRTTRSVSPTDIGLRLLDSLSPRFEEISNEIAAIGDTLDKPAGTIRISATDYAIQTILWPRLGKVLKAYPDINIELINDYGLTDIVANRFDAGVRLGEQVTNGMISVRIGPDMRFIAVASPEYLGTHGIPATPHQLAMHRCINLRLPSHGGFYVWEFAKDGKEVKARVDGQVVFNSVYQVVDAAIDGYGIAHVPEDLVSEQIAQGTLQQVLDEWTPYWDGLHIFYSSRRQSSRAMNIVIDALRIKNA